MVHTDIPGRTDPSGPSGPEHAPAALGSLIPESSFSPGAAEPDDDEILACFERWVSSVRQSCHCQHAHGIREIPDSCSNALYGAVPRQAVILYSPY